MTSQLHDSKKLEEIIKSKNISLDFLSSSIKDENIKYEIRTILKQFSWVGNPYVIHNIFDLLTKSKNELLRYRNVGQIKLDKLSIFLAEHNCYIGMFRGYSSASFRSLNTENISIDTLNEKEKTLALHLINELVKDNQDDYELGKEIRRIFSAIN
jgi:hypothetical protein